MNIALLGGTFDPVHNAHLAIAVAARDTYALDRVLMIPAAKPPHKTGRSTATYEHRYRMVELACRDIAGLEPSRLEEGDETSYSLRTISRVRAMLTPVDRLYFLIGADAFAEVRSWYRWQEVLRAVEFIVVTRPGHTYDVPESGVAHPLRTVDLPVSSSEIRERLARGEAPAELPPAVLDYIRTHGLYRYSTGV